MDYGTTCDICRKVLPDGYIGYNSWYGYCDNLECKKTAGSKENDRRAELAWYDIENGNTPDYEELQALI